MTAEPFETARLAMRPQRIEDAEALHEAYRDEDLMKYWGSAPKTTLAETTAYLAEHLQSRDWRGWAITLKGDDRAIGTLGAGLRRAGVSELGYMLLRDAWGQGYAREAVSALIDRMFVIENHRRIFADTDPDNVPSIVLLESLGFQREGLLRAEWDTHIGVRDSIIWGLLRNEWRGGA